MIVGDPGGQGVFAQALGVADGVAYRRQRRRQRNGQHGQRDEAFEQGETVARGGAGRRWGHGRVSVLS